MQDIIRGVFKKFPSLSDKDFVELVRVTEKDYPEIKELNKWDREVRRELDMRMLLDMRILLDRKNVGKMHESS